MIELGIQHYKGMQEFPAEKISSGIKPCLLFAGEDFKTDPDLSRLQNLLIDLFQRESVDSVSLKGLEHVLMFTACNGILYFRSYRYFIFISTFRVKSMIDNCKLNCPFCSAGFC